MEKKRKKIWNWRKGFTISQHKFLTKQTLVFFSVSLCTLPIFLSLPLSLFLLLYSTILTAFLLYPFRQRSFSYPMDNGNEIQRKICFQSRQIFLGDREIWLAWGKFSFEAGKFDSREANFPLRQGNLPRVEENFPKIVEPKYSLTAHGSSWDAFLQMYSGTEKVARYLWFSYIIYLQRFWGRKCVLIICYLSLLCRCCKNLVL